MNVWQAIVSALKAEKTNYIFGLPEGELFYDALYDVRKIKTGLEIFVVMGRWKMYVR